MTVGVGEAGGVPPSYAIISDISRRGGGTALGIYNLGPPIGAAIGIAFGASIAAAFRLALTRSSSIGAVGIITAIAVRLLIVAIPSAADRHRRDASASHKAPVLRDDEDVLLATRCSMRASLGSGATQFVTYGMGNFTTSCS